MSELIINLIIAFIIIWTTIEFCLSFANKLSVSAPSISHKDFMNKLRIFSFSLFLITLVTVQINLDIFVTKIKFICNL
ncbi:MAG: hypothetical protein CL762_05130 [Chloroflexi bacterium]|nr:hypothetical protein [Chloroflexota bacterium]MBM02081.1 hypothetical protein [Chloroflexota bacterium]|tara:strand:- start:9127 stop:9360 length:234 start_codon:yes stop_codon:yes gene_type:complete